MSDTKLKHMVSVNGLRNSPVRPEHVTNASRIFGPNVAALEGKTVRRPSPRVHTDGGITSTIPDDFHRLHNFVTNDVSPCQSRKRYVRNALGQRWAVPQHRVTVHLALDLLDALRVDAQPLEGAARSPAPK